MLGNYIFHISARHCPAPAARITALFDSIYHDFHPRKALDGNE